MKMMQLSMVCALCMVMPAIVAMEKSSALKGMTATTPVGQAMELADDVTHIVGHITGAAGDLVQVVSEPSVLTTAQAITIAAETNDLAQDANELADDIVDVVGSSSIQQLAQKWALPGAMGVVTTACVLQFLRNGNYALAGGAALVGGASTLYAWYLRTRQTIVADQGAPKRLVTMRTGRERRLVN